MRFVLVLALVGCDEHASKPVLRSEFVEQLTERDRGELIQLRGTVAKARGKRVSDELRIEFTLSHGGRDVTVVVKGVQPDRFRDNALAVVTGRWTKTARVRDDLDREGFADVTSEDVFLAREVRVLPPEF